MTALETSNLLPFRVTYREEPGDKHFWVFDCWAEDDDHATEQAENAYPCCEIINVFEFE
ncbi:MAG: hypothetical protein PHP32_03510 [Candidatus Izemoplasmatales bacterium]|nr:hypothetical protein [Candidatus Izemoplasmatales bacterium]